MRQLRSGSVFVMILMPNSCRNSFMCGLPTKLSSASSKPCKEDRNVYVLFELSDNKDTRKVNDLQRTPVFFRNGPRWTGVSTPGLLNATEILPICWSRDVGQTLLGAISEKIGDSGITGKGTYKHLSCTGENVAGIHRSWNT